jgi:hypothetical protein
MDFIAAAAEERVEPEQLPERITSAPAGGVAPAAIRP